MVAAELSLSIPWPVIGLIGAAVSVELWHLYVAPVLIYRRRSKRR